MSLMCASPGADVTSIDGVCTEGMKFIQNRLKPRISFYAIDMISPSFFELGRFDIILYLGVLYHTIYPFEQVLRLASACRQNGRLFLFIEISPAMKACRQSFSIMMARSPKT